MNEAENVSPGAETQNQAPAVETPEVTTPEVVETPDKQAEDAPKDEQDDAQKAIKAMQRRIDKRTADLYRERAEKEHLSQRLAEIEARLNQGGGEPGEIDAKRLEEYADKLAEAKTTQKEFDRKGVEVTSAGRKRFSDFDTAVQAVAIEVGPFADQRGLPTALGRVVLDCEDPAAVIHHLGSNPEIASELRGLSEGQLGRRLARIESELKAPKEPKTSNAPKPITPVKSAMRDDGGLRDDLPIDEWMKRRRAQLSAR